MFATEYKWVNTLGIISELKPIYKHAACLTTLKEEYITDR